MIEYKANALAIKYTDAIVIPYVNNTQDNAMTSPGTDIAPKDILKVFR